MLIYNNQYQKEEVEEVCKQLTKKGYLYKLGNNFLNNGVVIEILPNIQIAGQITIFDNGNWIKDISLKNISLYHNGKIEVYEDLLKYGSYKIAGELPLNI